MTAVERGPTVEELSMLSQAARDAFGLLAFDSADDARVPNWASSWATLAAQGLWSTIESPDGSLAAAAVVAEEAGRARYPGPVCESLTASYLLDHLSDSASLRAVADGSPAAVFVIEGAPSVIPQPETLLLVSTGDSGLVAITAAEVEWSDIASLDVGRRTVLMSVGGERAESLSSADPLLVAKARAALALLYCADTLGSVEHVLHRGTEYAGQRTTFGSPIGKYQAVAHRFVDHAVTVQQIRLLLASAIAAFDEDSDDLALQVATVETMCHGRSSEIVSDCIQLAGAIGFTWEFGHHFYLRRVVQNASLGGGFGRPAQRLAREASW